MIDLTCLRSGAIFIIAPEDISTVIVHDPKSDQPSRFTLQMRGGQNNDISLGPDDQDTLSKALDERDKNAE